MKTTTTALGDVVWTPHELPTAALSYRGHLRFLQGAPLRDLFLPFLLLRGTPSPIWRVPFEVRDAVLAEIHSAPADLPFDQLCFELLKSLAEERVS